MGVVMAYTKEYYQKNGVRLREIINTNTQKHIKGVSDYYIKSLLCGMKKTKDVYIPQELIEAKRIAVLIERELRNTLPKGRRNPEKRKAQLKAWWANNKEKKLIYAKKYRELNREKRNEAARQYRLKQKMKGN